MVYSRTERVFILEHYFASKSFVAVREAFSNAYPDKELPNKTIHRLVTKFRDTGSVCDKCSSSDKTAEITAVPISSSASAATTGQRDTAARIKYCHWFRRFVLEEVHV
jgi:hypothetical protein